MSEDDLKHNDHLSRRGFLYNFSKLASLPFTFIILPPFILSRKHDLLDVSLEPYLKGVVPVSDKPGLLKENKQSVGFWDQGFVLGRVRTDYNSRLKGTKADPLILAPCLFGGGDPLIIPAGPSWDRKGCALSPSTFSRSNSYTNVSPWPKNNFWVLSVNNEPAYQKGFNSGPPNQSLPISKPGEGIIGFAVKKEKYGDLVTSKAILSLDHTFAPSGSEGYIPFLGIGADSERGNGKPITLLNPSKKNIPQKISFTAKTLKEKNIGSEGTAGIFWFIASAKWGGKNRMIFIALHHNGIKNKTGNKNFIHGHWNWNIKESFYYPGGDLIYMDAEDITAIDTNIMQITSVGQENTYTIDLQKLFEIGSNNINEVTFDSPLPQSENVSVTGVHWAIEMTGKDTALEFMIQDMRVI